MADRQYLEQLSRRLADEGRLIEAGWIAMRLHVIPLDASPVQLNEMRYAFMGGAQHLFASIMTILDPGIEETPGDLRRMDLIHKELEAFRQEMGLRAAKPAGKG
ncbi:MAG: hypothetical protein ABSC06_20155 [Rhodopila sp.]|jgi:hypothetical protein